MEQLKKIWNTVKDFFVGIATNQTVIDFALRIMWALLAFVIGYILIKILYNFINKTLSKTKMDKITISFLLSILKFVAYLVLILIVADILGFAVTGVVALLGTAGLTIGLALQDSLSNLANGIVIITTKPFKEGDFVEIGGVSGTVKSIAMLTTTIVTTDNKVIIIPNSKIVTTEIINYNALGRRRVDFTFGVAYESDVNLVRQIILDVINSNGKVYNEPAPFVSLKTLNESSIDFFANCWVDAEDYWNVYYYVTQNVFNEFNRHGISVPYNQVEVRLRNDEVVMPYNKEKLPERVEKVREEKVEGDILDQIIHAAKKKHKKAKEKSQKEKVAKQEKNKADKK